LTTSDIFGQGLGGKKEKKPKRAGEKVEQTRGKKKNTLTPSNHFMTKGCAGGVCGIRTEEKLMTEREK